MTARLGMKHRERLARELHRNGYDVKAIATAVGSSEKTVKRYLGFKKGQKHEQIA